ncbi:hypothetical protein OFN10_31655, partial [Escherichia coli]|nr:hypothetical protein [Escherichia coli]
DPDLSLRLRAGDWVTTFAIIHIPTPNKRASLVQPWVEQALTLSHQVFALTTLNQGNLCEHSTTRHLKVRR